MAIVTLIILFLCCISLYIVYVRKKLNYWKDRGVPHKKPNIFTGNVVDAMNFHKNLDLEDIKTNYYNYYPDERYFGVYFIHQPSLILKDPELIRSVLVSNFDCFTDRHNFRNNADVFSQNLPLLSGLKWKMLRKKLTPIFTANSMKRMFYLLTEQADEMVKYIEDNEIKSDASNIQYITENYIMDVLGSVALGLSINSTKDHRREFHNIIFSFTHTNILYILRIIFKVCFETIANWFQIGILPKKVEDFFLGISNQVVTSRKNTTFKRHDLIDLLLELEKNDEIEVDYKFVASQAVSFILPGFESTAGNLMFTLYELAHNQEIQENLFNEIEEVLEKHSGNLTYDTVSNMPYMEAVIDEALRKYPFFVHIPKMCTRPIKLPDTDFTIEKNMHVMIPLLNLHHDSKYYPDPDKFIPERFLNNDKAKRNNMTYLPFGGGPRCCIGIRFVYLQVKVALITILRKYKLKPSNKTKYPLELHSPMGMIKPKNDVWVKFIKRDEQFEFL